MSACVNVTHLRITQDKSGLVLKSISHTYCFTIFTLEKRKKEAGNSTVKGWCRKNIFENNKMICIIYTHPGLYSP